MKPFVDSDSRVSVSNLRGGALLRAEESGGEGRGGGGEMESFAGLTEDHGSGIMGEYSLTGRGE